MKLLDKIKETFSKIFLKKQKPMALPSAQDALSKKMEQYTFIRENGTKIMIMPQGDRTDNQTFESVYNYRTRELQNVAKYIVNAPELGEHFRTILIELDPSLLLDPRYNNYIVNILLSSERMSKIINEYKGYAGGIKLDKDGNIHERYIDSGITQGLQASAQQRNEEYQRQQQAREAENIEKLLENRPHIHVKDSHAEDLSKYDFR